MNLIEKIKFDFPNAKNVFFFNSHNIWKTHFETELELIDLLQNSDFNVSSFVCNGILKGCDTNPHNSKAICSNCMVIRNAGYNLILPVNEMIEINQFKFNKFLDLKSIRNIEDLKKVKYFNYDVGYAVLSSFVSRLRDPYLNYEYYKSEIEILINQSIFAYEFFKKSLIDKKPDLVFIFNGRFTYCRALLRACESIGINYYTHERGSSKEKFMLYKNSMPHDIGTFNSLLHEKWNSHDINDSTKLELANKFYVDRLNGKEQSWYSFTINQKNDELPAEWDSNKHNIVIFLSSEDEFVAIGDMWGDTIFKDQIEGLQFIFSNYFDFNIFKFYIRIHPNSKNLEQFIHEIYKFESPLVGIIHPESSVSSYKLLFSSKKVITFGSTMGIEATYWGKPSINLGNSFYKQLDVTFNPKTIDQILPLILNTSLEPKKRENTLAYGFYLGTFGLNFTFYVPESFNNGYFKGINLHDHIDIKQKLFSNRINWPYRIRKNFQKIEFKIRSFLLNITFYRLNFIFKFKKAFLNLKICFLSFN